jgi:hypothetical protein
MADLVYNKVKQYIGDKTIGLDSDVLKCMLLADTYTPLATHSVKADVVANELAAADGYNTGGYTLQNVTWADTAGITMLDADDPVWTSASFIARYGLVYSDTPTDPADPLIVLLDFLANKTGQGGNFYITIHANGLLRSV